MKQNVSIPFWVIFSARSGGPRASSLIKRFSVLSWCFSQGVCVSLAGGAGRGELCPSPPCRPPGSPQHRDPQQRPHPWGHLGSCCRTLGGACFGGVLLLTPLRSRKLKAGAMHKQICAMHCDNCIVTLKEEEEGECSEAWGHSVTHPGPLRASIGTSISVGPQGSLHPSALLQQKETVPLCLSFPSCAVQVVTDRPVFRRHCRQSYGLAERALPQTEMFSRNMLGAGI